MRSTGRISSDIVAIWPGALLCVYLVATLALLLVGPGPVPTAGIVVHGAVLAALAAATWMPRVPRWLRRWAPLMSLLFLYTELPLLIRAAGHIAVFDGTVMRWESQLFGAQPALRWAAAWPSKVLSETLHAAYLSYYAIIFAVPAALAMRRRDEEFAEAVFVLMLTFVCCFVAFIAFPVAGPRYLWRTPAEAVSGPMRELTLWILEARSSRGTAFPSSHVAVATTQSILAILYFRRRGGVLAIASVLLALGAVYGGFHYGVDVLAGVLFGVGTTVVGLSASRAFSAAPATQANATAPT